MQKSEGRQQYAGGGDTAATRAEARRYNRGGAAPFLPSRQSLLDGQRQRGLVRQAPGRTGHGQSVGAGRRARRLS
jgi:hypothetical protein